MEKVKRSMEFTREKAGGKRRKRARERNQGSASGITLLDEAINNRLTDRI